MQSPGVFLRWNTYPESAGLGTSHNGLDQGAQLLPALLCFLKHSLVGMGFFRDAGRHIHPLRLAEKRPPYSAVFGISSSAAIPLEDSGPTR